MGEYEEQTPNGFPAGLRVLAVDDDSVVLRTLELQLLKCGYKVTVTHHALEALKLLRMNKDQYDLVISDVNMPDMDGFKLLDIVGLEMDLPVIMLSVECDFKNVMKGVMHGAVDYIVKPVRLQELKLIWKHVVRRSLKEKKDSNDTSNKLESAAKSKYVHKSKQTKNCKDHKKVREKDDCADSGENMAAQKKPRVAWTPDLHTKFINVVQELGISRAVPKNILDIMNIPGLTRENVASHLQKYRKGLKKIELELNQQLFNHVGSSACSGSSLPMIFNQERTAMCSFDRTQDKYHRNKPVTSSYFHAQQSFQVSSTCFSHSLSLQNNFCRPYAMNPQTRELITQQSCCTTNSYMKKASSQVLSYHSFDPRSNHRDGYAESSQNFGLNSVYQLGHASDNQTVDMFLSNNLLDNCNSTELDASLASEQEQNQFNYFTEEDVNTSNRNYYMESCPNFSVRTFSFDKVEHTDDLHAAFQQFQR